MLSRESKTGGVPDDLVIAIEERLKDVLDLW